LIESHCIKSRAHCGSTRFRAQRTRRDTGRIFGLRPSGIISADDHQSAKSKTSHDCEKFDASSESKIDMPEFRWTVNCACSFVFITLTCRTIPNHACRIDHSSKVHRRLKQHFRYSKHNELVILSWF